MASEEVKFLNQLIYKEYKDSDMNAFFTPDTEFEGILECSKPIKIQGIFKGTIYSEGFVWIDAGAFIEADLYVGSLKLGGVLKGNIDANYKVELLAGSKLYGNIRSARLKIANGVSFEGNCEMISN